MSVVFKALFIINLCIIILFNIIGADISDQRLCADPKCSKLISKGYTKIKHIGEGGDPRILQFKDSENVLVYSKGAGNRTDLWGVEIRGKRGYAPYKFILEKEVLVKHPTFTVPTEESGDDEHTSVEDVQEEDGDSGNNVPIDPTPAQEEKILVDGTLLPASSLKDMEEEEEVAPPTLEHPTNQDAASSKAPPTQSEDLSQAPPTSQELTNQDSNETLALPTPDDEAEGLSTEKGASPETANGRADKESESTPTSFDLANQSSTEEVMNPPTLEKPTAIGKEHAEVSSATIEQATERTQSPPTKIQPANGSEEIDQAPPTEEKPSNESIEVPQADLSIEEPSTNQIDTQTLPTKENEEGEETSNNSPPVQTLSKNKKRKSSSSPNPKKKFLIEKENPIEEDPLKEIKDYAVKDEEKADPNPKLSKLKEKDLETKENDTEQSESEENETTHAWTADESQKEKSKTSEKEELKEERDDKEAVGVTESEGEVKSSSKANPFLSLTSEVDVSGDNASEEGDIPLSKDKKDPLDTSTQKETETHTKDESKSSGSIKEKSSQLEEPPITHNPDLNSDKQEKESDSLLNQSEPVPQKITEEQVESQISVEVHNSAAESEPTPTDESENTKVKEDSESLQIEEESKITVKSINEKLTEDLSLESEDSQKEDHIPNLSHSENGSKR